MVATASHGLRRVLHRWLKVPAEPSVAYATRDLARLRLAWIEAASDIVKAGEDRPVRERLICFFLDHLGAEHAELSVPIEGESDAALMTSDRPRLALPRVGLQLEVRLAEGAAWSREELELATRAAETAEAVLVAHAQLREVHAQSVTDSLTGLLNRRGLASHLSREALLARRHGYALSVAAIDVDHFKAINDTLGHAAGDDVLRAIADRLVSTLRRTDLIYRMGGDEFVVLLPQTQLAHAVLAMEKAQRANASPTLSVGIAELKADQSVAELLAAADAALYRAKAAARNCIQTAA